MVSHSAKGSPCAGLTLTELVRRDKIPCAYAHIAAEDLDDLHTDSWDFVGVPTSTLDDVSFDVADSFDEWSAESDEGDLESDETFCSPPRPPSWDSASASTGSFGLGVDMPSSKSNKPQLQDFAVESARFDVPFGGFISQSDTVWPEQCYRTESGNEHIGRLQTQPGDQVVQADVSQQTCYFDDVAGTSDCWYAFPQTGNGHQNVFVPSDFRRMQIRRGKQALSTGTSNWTKSKHRSACPRTVSERGADRSAHLQAEYNTYADTDAFYEESEWCGNFVPSRQYVSSGSRQTGYMGERKNISDVVWHPASAHWAKTGWNASGPTRHSNTAQSGWRASERRHGHQSSNWHGRAGQVYEDRWGSSARPWQSRQASAVSGWASGRDWGNASKFRPGRR
eukprot:TRINITY_DN47929_c0_g1_i1.p1 TRINITY_DN47929_c0_g1~~TRINITY_DN47929_c0_g1_i1.p1  ORF type:complete len:418 (-),score=6.14 TRINITY_DN47929_c0_g1_i1:151-1332(-)